MQILNRKVLLWSSLYVALLVLIFVVKLALR
jgi:hypothetical protein